MKTKIILILALALIAGIVGTTAQAAGHLQSNLNCAQILESWAVDPDSVPKDRVDECKGIKGAAAAVPVVVPFSGGAAETAADPCSGPNAAGSVHCWGPWSALAPAAGGQFEPPVLQPVEEYDIRPELAERYGPDVFVCPPGLPCGYATVVDGVSSDAPADQTTFAGFELASDGSAFIVLPADSGEIASVTNMSQKFIDRPDDYENMRSQGTDGDERSRVVARVRRNADGEITEAADIWVTGNSATRVAQSGYFAWGYTTSVADLEFLRGAGASAVFSGPMSVDNATLATVTVNFGSDTSWAGAWTNPAYSFDAGGAFVGADMISDAGKFSANVGPDSFVRGALLGQRDDMSIAHIIDVDLAGVGRIKDVGLLRN